MANPETNEQIEYMGPSPESIKANALNTCRSAYDSCRGSGQISTELKKAAGAYINLPLGVASKGLKACFELATIQPIKATCTLAKGLTDACKDFAKIAVAPVPVALAAAETTLKTTKNAAVTVAKLPVTAPLAAYRTVERGADKMLGLFGAGQKKAAPVTTDGPSGDNAKTPHGASTDA